MKPVIFSSAPIIFIFRYTHNSGVTDTEKNQQILFKNKNVVSKLLSIRLRYRGYELQ